jgi:hypothetical protein
MMIKLCKLTHKGEILKYKGAGDGAGPCTCSAPQCTLGKIYPMRPPAWIGNTKIQGGWSQGWIPHVRRNTPWAPYTVRPSACIGNTKIEGGWGRGWTPHGHAAPKHTHTHTHSHTHPHTHTHTHARGLSHMCTLGLEAIVCN